jgi:methylglyoxal synthase
MEDFPGNSPRNSKRSETFRASTAHVDIADIRARLGDMERLLTAAAANSSSTKDSGGLTCKYDLSKHVLSYLPTPEVEGAVDNELPMGEVKANLTDNSKFLGVQSNPNPSRKSILRPTGSTNADDIDMDPEFDSMFGPNDMRMMALVSHNNMKHSMKQFVLANKNVLKKFRLTGTNTTMSMLKEVFGPDPDVIYGPACKSGPLGGDAQLVAMAVTGQLGGCIFFIDPMDAHPHSADIECLVRQGNVHNVVMMNNPTTAHVCLSSLRVAMKMGRVEMFPSFFFDLESPSVAAYKERQNNVLQAAIQGINNSIPTREANIRRSMHSASKVGVRFEETGVAPAILEEEEEQEAAKAEETAVPSGESKKKKKKKWAWRR